MRAPPKAAQYREELASGLTDLAHTLGRLALGRPEDSVAADRRAVDIQEKLTADFPSVPEYRYRHAMSVYGLANHLADLRRMDAAEPEYRRAIASLEKLMTEYPYEPRYASSLARVFADMGLQYDFCGQTQEAEAALRKAIKLDPANSGAPARLAVHLTAEGRRRKRTRSWPQ